MITYKPGMAFVGMFTTQLFSTGTATDADSLPVATATKNGIDDAGFVLTVAKIDTGRYKVTGTVPLAYTVNDVVHISAAATVGGVSGKAVVEEFVIEEASGANVVTITVEEADHTPIPDASVRILNSAETLTLLTGTTDVSGQLVVALNDGSYKIRLSKAMVNFTTPETLTVSGTTAKTCTGTVVSPTAPGTGLQTLVIYPADLGLTYQTTMVFTAVISRINEEVDTAVLTSQITTATDMTTHFEMQLAKGAVVTVMGKYGDKTFFKKDFTVDTNDVKNLVDYIP